MEHRRIKMTKIQIWFTLAAHDINDVFKSRYKGKKDLDQQCINERGWALNELERLGNEIEK